MPPWSQQAATTFQERTTCWYLGWGFFIFYLTQFMWNSFTQQVWESRKSRALVQFNVFLWHFTCKETKQNNNHKKYFSLSRRGILFFIVLWMNYSHEGGKNYKHKCNINAVKSQRLHTWNNATWMSAHFWFTRSHSRMRKQLLKK